MTPEEAASVQLEEPDWLARFAEAADTHANLPRYLAEDSAFESTLREWRRFHGKPIRIYDYQLGKVVSKTMPASGQEGVIALARLGIFPARFLDKDLPRGEMLQEQHDNHMWLIVSQEAWRITEIQDRMLCLRRGWEGNYESQQIDLTRARWTKYCEAAAAALDGRN